MAQDRSVHGGPVFAGQSFAASASACASNSSQVAPASRAVSSARSSCGTVHQIWLSPKMPGGIFV
jgi:hypothetical protein